MEDWVRADSYPALGFKTSSPDPLARSLDDAAALRGEKLSHRGESGRPARAAATPPPTGNYFARHWRGNLSLPVSYWVNGTLGTVAIVALMVVARSMDLGKTLGAFGSGALILGFLGFAYAGTIWQLVGIWRSAGHHPDRGGSTGWAAMAKVMVVIGFLSGFGQVAQQLPLWKQAFQLVAGVDVTPNSEFRVLNRATELEVSGGMSFGTADALETILKATPSIRVVHLNSVGGWIKEGERVGTLMESYGLTTFTEHECVSACLLAFLGGKERLLGVGARLGFHQASVGGVGGEVAKGGNDAFRAL